MCAYKCKNKKKKKRASYVASTNDNRVYCRGSACQTRFRRNAPSTLADTDRPEPKLPVFSSNDDERRRSLKRDKPRADATGNPRTAGWPPLRETGSRSCHPPSNRGGRRYSTTRHVHVRRNSVVATRTKRGHAAVNRLIKRRDGGEAVTYLAENKSDK